MPRWRSWLGVGGTPVANLLRGYAWPTPPPDPDQPVDTCPAEEERRVGFGYGDDGTWSLSVRLPGDEGAVIEAALGAKRDELWQAADDKADREQITWADALLALVDSGAAHAVRAGPPGTVTR